MDRQSYAGVNWTKIFYSAMSKVFFDQHLKPGDLYTGRLGLEARKEIENNGNRFFGFTMSDVTRFLDQGSFNYRPPEGEMSYLLVEGMDRGDGDYFATGDLGGRRICFNCNKHQSTAEALANRGWPADSTGVEMLAWFTAATVLHEILHNQGFSHPKVVTYTPGSDYSCSLPYVAERAVLRCSPYWSTFEEYYKYSGRIWLASGGELSCRCKIK